MKAYITFIRKLNNENHMIGVKNPTNIDILQKFNLYSGQPIICVIENDLILAFYIIENTKLNQIYGNEDKLFQIKILNDLSLINLKKYNVIKYFLIKIYEKLSFKDLNENINLLLSFEEKIFYSLLHIDICIYKIKRYIKKEIMKFDFPTTLKSIFLSQIDLLRMPAKKIINKKIDLNLSGYGIYINSKILQSD